MALVWDDERETLFAADLTAALGYRTPAGGVVVQAVAHSYGPQLIGVNARQHTGWLEVDDRRMAYAPHTETGYRTPPNKTLQLLINGALAKQGVRAARTPEK